MNNRIIEVVVVLLLGAIIGSLLKLDSSIKEHRAEFVRECEQRGGVPDTRDNVNWCFSPKAIIDVNMPSGE